MMKFYYDHRATEFCLLLILIVSVPSAIFDIHTLLPSLFYPHLVQDDNHLDGNRTCWYAKPYDGFCQPSLAQSWTTVPPECRQRHGHRQ